MKPSLRRLLILCALVSAATQQGTTISTKPASTTGTTISSTAGTTGTTISTKPASTTGTTISTTAGTTGTTISTKPAGTTGATVSTTAGTTGATVSTKPAGTTGTTISTTAGTTGATVSTKPAGTTGTTIGTTAGTTGATVSTTAGTTGATVSTKPAGTTGTTISTTAGTTGTTDSTTAGTTGTTISTTAGTTGTTISTTADTPATTTKGPCSPNPCVGNGICEERFGGAFVCLCRSGLVYDDTVGCISAKVFPGNLVLTESFKDEMADKKSSLFNATAAKIQQQLQVALQGNGYIGSVVLSLRSGSIVAEVQNFYQVTSSATTQTVGDQIKNAITSGIIANGSTFDERNVCSIGVCDDGTTSCDGDGIAVCTCKDGYIMSEFTHQACIACPNGEKAVDSKSCEKCSFGFSGFNCNDPYLLVVVVVSCGLGALLIIFIIALIVVSCRKQKESSQSKDDFSPYGTVEMQKPAGIPRIPRANPNSGMQSEYQEITNGGSTQSLVTRTQPENKTRYTNYDDDDVRYRNRDSPVFSGVKVMENGLRGVQNPYYRRDEDSMRR